MIVKDEVIRSSSTVKYLGVYLDQNLTFQEEVKHILRKIAGGIKTLYSITDCFPEKIGLLLLNALVSSYLHENNPEPRLFTSKSFVDLIFGETVFSRKLYPCGTPCQKIYAKKCLFATAKIKIKNFLLTKMKAEINFPEYGKNVGITTDLNSVHRLYSFSSCLLPFKLALILITLFLL